MVYWMLVRSTWASKIHQNSVNFFISFSNVFLLHFKGNFGAHLCSKTRAKVGQKMEPTKGCPEPRTQIGAQGTPQDGVGQPKGEETVGDSKMYR